MKLLPDEGVSQANGKVETRHYEMTRTKISSSGFQNIVEAPLKQQHIYALVPAVVFAMALAACTSSTGPRKDNVEQANAKSNGHADSKVTQSDSNPGINLNCTVDRIQNPPDSFHYSYKKDSSAPVHVEADITPQVIDGFRVDINGQQHPLHGVQSDTQSWQAAWSGLTQISGMSSTVALVNHNSAMHREAAGGEVNGYKSIHYSIDTARFEAAENRMLLNPGHYGKGEAWVTSEGCPVKLVLDSELHRKDGTLIEKIHYEETMVKK